MTPARRIGPLRQWCCSYLRGGRRFGITLWAVSGAQIEAQWGPSIQVDGELIGETQA